MQVNSVSSNNIQSFGQSRYQRPETIGMEYEVLETLANAKDSQLAGLAAKEASIAVNDKKHRRINNALWYGLPVAAGIAAVVRNPAKAIPNITKPPFLSTARSARFLNLKNFAGTTLSWAGSFALIDMLFAGKRKLENSNETVRNFDRNHPFLSFGAAIGAIIGASVLGAKGVSKLSSAAVNKFGGKIESAGFRLNKALEGSRVLDKASELAGKVPSSIRSFAKGLISWTPMMMVLASITHSFNHAAVKNSVTYQKYDELKTAREEARTILKNADDIQEAAEEA